MTRFLYLIPLFPLLGFLFNFTVGVRVLGRSGHRPDGHGGGHGESHGGHGPSPIVGLVACGSVLLSVLVSVFAVVRAQGAPGHTLVETLWAWIPGGAAELSSGAAPFQVDWAYQV